MSLTIASNRKTATEQARLSKKYFPALLVLPYVSLLLTAYSVFAETVDDPFITFRYAMNLVRGYGPVFNIGERVEGFTSPLHLLLCALFLKLAPALSLLFIAKLFSVLMGMLTIWQTGRLARQVGLRDLWPTLAQMLLALNMDFAVTAVNAMETTLYAFLLTASLGCFLHESRRQQGNWSSVLLFVTLLARPETMLVFVALLCVRVLAWRRAAASSSFVLAWAGLFCALSAVLLGARLAFYRLPLPNTYYAKNDDWKAAVVSGAHYLIRPLPGQEHSLLPFTPCFWGLALLGLWHLRRHVSGWTLGAVLAGTVVFILKAGGDWMSGWRFMIGALPAIALLQCWGVRSLVASTRQPLLLRWPWLQRGAAILVIAFTLAVWGLVALEFPHESWARAGFSTQAPSLLVTGYPMGKRWVAVSDFVRDQLPPGVLIAYSEMGYVSYSNMDQRFIDTRGLTQRQIAQLPTRYKTNVGVIDGQWFEKNDSMCLILHQLHPYAIISLEYPAQSNNIMSGYHLAAEIGSPQDNPWRTHATRVYLADATHLLRENRNALRIKKTRSQAALEMARAYSHEVVSAEVSDCRRHKPTATALERLDA